MVSNVLGFLTIGLHHYRCFDNLEHNPVSAMKVNLENFPLETNKIPLSSKGNIYSNERRYEDPLLDYISPSSTILQELLSQGYSVVPSVLLPHECDDAIDLIWDFVEETSSGCVSRDDPSTWYPSPNGNTDTSYLDECDPWPHSRSKEFSEVFQFNGAGWVLGSIREKLAERIFEPLFQTRELHSSKEGFTFHRPMAPLNGYKPPQCWITSIKTPFMADDKHQELSVGEHYSQCKNLNGLHKIRSLVVLEDQVDGVDGGFMCYPGSHGKVHQAITRNTKYTNTSCFPLRDDEIRRLTTEFGCSPVRLYLSKGDVILWRSDLVHAQINPSSHSSRLLVMAYCSMQPSSLTRSGVWLEKMNAYKQRQTGDHRPEIESWHTHVSNFPYHRPYYRGSPPLLTIRLAELYGLVPYSSNPHDHDLARERAIIRGVRFLPSDLPTRPTTNRRCDAQLVLLNVDDSSQMAGQDKYLGGMPSPCGRYIYGVPGTAKRVLRVNANTGSMDWIGPEFDGKFKWLRGLEIPPSVMNLVDYPDGCCIGLPCNYPAVLKINPANNHVYTFGEELLDNTGCDGWLYHGGNLAQNGWIYAIPANANRVLKMNPSTDEVCYIGPTFGGPQKWFGGIVGSDNCIYGIPHNEVGVLRIDPKTDDVTVLMLEDGSPLPPGRWKWHGGLEIRNKIYGFPNNSDQVLVIDCETQRVYTVGNDDVLKSGRHRVPQDGRYKYLGGSVTLDGKYAFLFPCDAEQVLRIDTVTDELRLVGPLLLDGENKYQNGFVASDGCLYGIPQRATGVLRVIPAAITGDEDHVDVMYCGDDLVGTKDKFEGGVLGLDGCIYCMPLRSRTCVKVIPAENSSASVIDKDTTPL